MLILRPDCLFRQGLTRTRHGIKFIEIFPHSAPGFVASPETLANSRPLDNLAVNIKQDKTEFPAGYPWPRIR